MAVKIRVKGVQYQSKLEAYTAKKLKDAGIPALYEEKTFTLIEGFVPNLQPWTYQWKKFKARDTRMKPITYTPDFVCPKGEWVIEVKGRKFADFMIKWKLFLRHLNLRDLTPEVFMPTNQKQVDAVVAYIKEMQNG